MIRLICRGFGDKHAIDLPFLALGFSVYNSCLFQML
jgi:hypothetical protein